MNPIRIGDLWIGNSHPCFIIAEIGINHNGDIDLAKKLIDAAIFAGCNAVKFQKRTVDVVYSKKELAKPRESPFGLTNGDLKRGLEFGQEQYEEIDKYCKSKGIIWFASCWDETSVDFIKQFNPPCYKIASASLTDDELLRYHRRKGKPIILSTGMSDLSMIRRAVEVLEESDLVIAHCTSTYPSKSEELNLRCINTLKREFREVPIGYSGHEAGLATTVAAMVLGACVVERHITLDRSMWGSDQAASVEPQGMRILIQNIREIEKALGDGNIRIYESEIPIMKKLRRK